MDKDIIDIEWKIYKRIFRERFGIKNDADHSNHTNKKGDKDE